MIIILLVTWSNFDAFLFLCIVSKFKGDTAWLLASTALVLMMTIPGLGLFYGGMVREKNVLSVLMQMFSITALITFLWFAFGYSLSFGPIGGKETDWPYHKNMVIGDSSRFWFHGLNVNSAHALAPTIPETVFCTYQLTFAIITAALISGSFADRMKFGPMLVFMALWHLLVYCPIAHWNWHPDGFLNMAGVLDFAGGNVVHIASGCAGLMSSIVVGNRKGFGQVAFPPYNILYSVTGAALLWVGWFGFTAGSAVAANTIAGQAMLNTQISAGTSALVWLFVDWAWNGKPSVLGIGCGAVAGLVYITPACGFVDTTGSFFIGLTGAPIGFFGAQLKHWAGLDDALDAFGIHAICGMWGGLMVGFFASWEISGGVDGIFYDDNSKGRHGVLQLAVQLYDIFISAGWSSFMSFVILKLVDVTMGLRISDLEELEGLDSSMHGENIKSVESQEEGLEMSAEEYEA